jgi:hypothetical protein
VGSGESFANDDEDIMEEQDKEEDWEDVEEWDQDYPVTRSTLFTFIKIQTIEFLIYIEGSRNLSSSVAGRYRTGQLLETIIDHATSRPLWHVGIALGNFWKLCSITKPLVLCGR